tara:strand:- start:60 stop:497 length:438 start_codon:yes stop_codon:yes gene_type:complete
MNKSSFKVVIFCVLFGFTILVRGETLTEITRIQYVETSLAKSEKFLFENGKITFFKGGSLKGRAELTKKQKIAFSKIVKLIDMDHLSTLAIPSKRFMFDGSAFGQLKIVSARKISSTPLFDVDNPPKEILELVRYLKNLAKVELT